MAFKQGKRGLWRMFVLDAANACHTTGTTVSEEEAKTWAFETAESRRLEEAME